MSADTVKVSIAKGALLLAALICIATAIAHMSCIPLGAGCYAAQMAPEEIVNSAEQGTWLAPVGTLVVSAVFIVWAVYALAVASWFSPLWQSRKIVYVIAGACIVRGVLGLQFAWRFPERVDASVTIASSVWLFTGLCFLLGVLWTPQARVKGE